ncbi:proton-dependent oligopeptide transporter, putative [Bodo saltans]|uniref:Proton-dependent oligopeptide transporter, putative n=1 Tax=Bodo saltans TaxID=75058 RepID=A0A0S4J2E0_BODSA|nr:proton-dependent oligopeptide transporter, putative [Bodo saltans]|eukprot:CUG58924.1 proton-dependent oligopeptide transporter, putative [Bodo saltans]
MLLEETATVEEDANYGATVRPSSARASDALLVDDCSEVQLRGTTAFFDEARGVTYYYRTNPLTYACPYILVQEMCERLAYYGLTPTLKNFVKSILDVSDSSASAYLGIFQGTMFVTPILSAIVADTFLGGYATILVFSSIYLLGLVHVLMATISEISAPWMLHVGLLVLISLGAGGIKSCVNVFGAQQFHPVAHKEKITSFFTLFYASINVGSLIGGLSCPQVAESVSYFAAYLIPLCSFSLAMAIFASPMFAMHFYQGRPSGQQSKRFKEKNRDAVASKKRTAQSVPPLQLLSKQLRSNRDDFDYGDTPEVQGKEQRYNQMTTAYLTQGEKMERTIFGFNFAAALMQNVDAITVIVASLVVERLLYTKLRSIDKMPSILSRFIIGNLFGAASLLSAFFVELVVKSEAIETVSIWWQVPQFAFIAIGEIFMISTGYEVAFTYAPSELKTVSSACNLIFFAIAGYLSAALFLICADWMRLKFRSLGVWMFLRVMLIMKRHNPRRTNPPTEACLAIRPFFKKMKPYHALPVDPESC